jgi:2-oxoisovalerate ferredoxin oxidoreductase beta subunit
MAEVIATLEAPVYVERVALFDGKQRAKARQAITRSLQLQLEGTGFSFVEVLAECPTHLGLAPAEAEAWVKAQMLPVFPLGVKKDLHPEPWPAWPVPSFDPATVLGAIGALAEAPPTFCQGFPRTPFGPDLGLKLAGAGGDGAQTAALLLTRAAIQEGFDATHISSYGPESRGGTSYADVRIADQEVLSPAVPHPHLLVAFNGPSLAKFGPEVLPGGVVVYDSSTISSLPALDPSVRVVGVPLSDLARGLGQVAVKNLVALGALLGAVPLFPHDTLLATLRQVLGVKKAAMLPVNQDAYWRGVEAVTGVPSAPRA